MKDSQLVEHIQCFHRGFRSVIHQKHILVFRDLQQFGQMFPADASGENNQIPGFLDIGPYAGQKLLAVQKKGICMNFISRLKLIKIAGFDCDKALEDLLDLLLDVSHGFPVIGVAIYN